MLVKSKFLSLDPYMRGRMNETNSYAASVQIGDVMTGETVGEVIESENRSSRPATRSARALAGSSMRSQTAMTCAR